jgi:hypothetical protein
MPAILPPPASCTPCHCCYKAQTNTSRLPFPSEILAMPLFPLLPSTTNPLLLRPPHSKPSPHMIPHHYPLTPNLHYHHQKSTPSPCICIPQPCVIATWCKEKTTRREVRSVERKRRAWGHEGPMDDKWVSSSTFIMFMRF